MGLYKRGPAPDDPRKDTRIWWYEFEFAGRRIRESAKTTRKTIAQDAEKNRRLELEKAYNGLADTRRERVRSVAVLAEEYRDAHMAVPGRTSQFVPGAVKHITRLCGSLMLVDVSDSVVKRYQTTRLKEGASPKTVNNETGVLLRILGDHGDLIRLRMKRQRTLNIPVKSEPGRAFTIEEQRAMLSVAKASTEAAKRAMAIRDSGGRIHGGMVQGGSVCVYPALVLALSCGLRAKELRGLRWSQVDLVSGVLTVGLSKTAAGTGRTIPLNPDALAAMRDHAAWYGRRFNEVRPEYYVFPGGSRWPTNPNAPITTLKTAWEAVRAKAGVSGRWHDARHTFITELAESGAAGDETIRSLAGHVSHQMLKHYSHIGMEAKRRAVDALSRKRLSESEVPTKIPTDAESGNGVPTKSPTGEAVN